MFPRARLVSLKMPNQYSKTAYAYLKNYRHCENPQLLLSFDTFIFRQKTYPPISCNHVYVSKDSKASVVLIHDVLDRVVGRIPYELMNILQTSNYLNFTSTIWITCITRQKADIDKQLVPCLINVFADDPL